MLQVAALPWQRMAVDARQPRHIAGAGPGHFDNPQLLIQPAL